MGVKVLTLNTSLVDHLEAFQRAGAFNGEAIMITHLDKPQIDDQQSSNVTYDLRVGRHYRYLTHDDSHRLEDGRSFDLEPGQSVVIETEEEIHMPRSTLGLIVSRVTLSQRGLSNICTKVDPGYHGPVVVTATNDSRRRVTLTRGEAFCSIVFLSVEANARLYAKGSKSVDSLPQASTWLQRRLDAIHAHGIIVHLGLVLVTLLLTVVTALLWWVKYRELTGP
jgi:deoxycytidine triphosphate deaminase